MKLQISACGIIHECRNTDWKPLLLCSNLIIDSLSPDEKKMSWTDVRWICLTSDIEYNVSEGKIKYKEQGIILRIGTAINKTNNL